MSTRTEKIEIFQSYNGTTWYWRYRATNGRVLADGGEGYINRGDAVRGALRVTGLDIPTYVGDIARLSGAHVGTPFGADLVRMYDSATAVGRGYLNARGIVYYFFDRLITDRRYDVELVQR